MPSGYRERALKCPACATVLEPNDVGDAVVDVCPSCSGVWVDWYDGQLEVLAGRAPRHAVLARASGEVGANECPRCGLQLHTEHVGKARTEVLRCGACAGAFVSRSGCDELMEQQPAPAFEEDRSWLERFAATLKDLLF